MSKVARMRLADLPWLPGRSLLNEDPNDLSVLIRFLGESLEDGPWAMQIRFEPGVKEPAHWHAHDTIYIFTAGEFHIGDEGPFRAGDVRWVRAGHFYGPEVAGPEGAEFFLISAGPDLRPRYEPGPDEVG